jgi:hypothetical protein
VLQVRKTVNPFRLRANRVVYRPKDGKKIVVLIDDPGGPGIEIAREALACRQCAESRDAASG